MYDCFSLNDSLLSSSNVLVLPDGPKIGSINLSPRYDCRMHSDASGRIWLEEIENMIKKVNV
jgi:hypothetical protein